LETKDKSIDKHFDVSTFGGYKFYISNVSYSNGQSVPSYTPVYIRIFKYNI